MHDSNNSSRIEVVRKRRKITSSKLKRSLLIIRRVISHFNTRKKNPVDSAWSEKNILRTVRTNGHQSGTISSEQEEDEKLRWMK